MVKSLSAAEITAMLDSIDSSRLTGDAADFYQKTREKIAKYGDTAKLTVPQRDWLKKLQKYYPAISPDRQPQARIPLEETDEPF